MGCGPTESAFHHRLRELSGPSAIDCGHVQISQSRDTALACFQSAMGSGQPFRVSVATYGLETIVTVAVARTPTGEVLMVAHDPDVLGGNGWFGFKKAKIFVQPCPFASVVLDESGSYSRMPLTCEPAPTGSANQRPPLPIAARARASHFASAGGLRATDVESRVGATSALR